MADLDPRLSKFFRDDAMTSADQYFDDIRYIANRLIEAADRRQADVQNPTPPEGIKTSRAEYFQWFIGDVENMVRNADFSRAARVATKLEKAFDE